MSQNCGKPCKQSRVGALVTCRKILPIGHLTFAAAAHASMTSSTMGRPRTSTHIMPVPKKCIFREQTAYMEHVQCLLPSSSAFWTCNRIADDCRYCCVLLRLNATWSLHAISVVLMETLEAMVKAWSECKLHWTVCLLLLACLAKCGNQRHKLQSNTVSSIRSNTNKLISVVPIDTC